MQICTENPQNRPKTVVLSFSKAQAHLCTMITMDEALRIMKLRDQRGWPQPFSITFFTADRKRGTGGELVKMDKVILAKNAQGHKNTTTAKEKTPGDSRQYISGTRNLYDLQAEQVRKCHLWLIHSINGQEVVL